MSNNNCNPNSAIIELPEGRDYSAEEVVDRVNIMIDAVKHHRKDDVLIYSASDIYWIIRNMFRYVNQRIHRGEFTLKRLKSGVWTPQYHRKSAGEQKADKRHKRQVDETRKLIERLKF